MGNLGKSVRVCVAIALLTAGAEAARAGVVEGVDPVVPISFTENRGQFAAEVLFQARVPGMTACVLRDGLLLALDAGGESLPLRLRFLGASSAARGEGLEPRSSRSHFFTGAAGWTRDVPDFARVRLSELYPGVALELYEAGGRLEYDLRLAPGADPQGIELALEGAELVAIDDSGALRAEAGGRVFAQRSPVAWQPGPGGEQRELGAAWRALGNGRFGLELRGHEPALGTVIDPVLVYSTHVGGSSADEALDACVADDGAVVVTGWTSSVDFPSRSGAVASRKRDGVVFKLTPDGRELVYTTHFGGRDDDRGVAIGVDESGLVYVAGDTESADFPTTPGSFCRESRGGRDGFLLVLAADGASLVYSTRFGGASEDVMADMALVPGGGVVFAGTTRSRDFPTSPSALETRARGARDAFVARFEPQGGGLFFSTRLGGTADDEAAGLAVDDAGAVYVTGRTESHDFPTTASAFDRRSCGADAFVAKLSGAGRTLAYSTFLGGSGADEGTAIAVDSQHRAVVVGRTHSLDFGFDRGTPPGKRDGFAVRLSEAGDALGYAQPLGGGSADEALGVALASDGAAWVVGSTRSPDFPVTRDALQERLLGSVDAFLVRLEPDSGRPSYATLLGTDGEDRLCAARADRAGSELVLVGSAAEIPLMQRGALGGKRRGPSDALVLRFDARSVAPAAQTSSPEPAAGGTGF